MGLERGRREAVLFLLAELPAGVPVELPADSAGAGKRRCGAGCVGKEILYE